MESVDRQVLSHDKGSAGLSGVCGFRRGLRPADVEDMSFVQQPPTDRRFAPRQSTVLCTTSIGVDVTCEPHEVTKNHREKSRKVLKWVRVGGPARCGETKNPAAGAGWGRN